MDAIENILSRNSSSRLTSPYPDQKEMNLVYQAALRAPDHAWLKPSEFIEITGNGLDKLSDIFVKYATDNIQNVNEHKIEKYKQAPYRAPMIIILVSNIKEHPKVPEIEQMLSTAAAAQNILLVLNALSYGAIWRTGTFALNDDISKYLGLNLNQKILGYLYVGTPSSEPKKIPNIDIDQFVTKWE
tara:strand:+ start:152 stop:709 length:558 start_codon:yes stop_codon:yes gene_type:complete